MRNNVIYPDLKNKTVVVTGAGEGIGESIAKAFLSQGSKVILVSRNDLKWGIAVDDKNIVFLKKDIRDLNYFREWIIKNKGSGNKIDILINNASVVSRQNLMQLTENEWDEVININSKATFFLSQLFAEQMIENKCGNIIFTGSFAARLPSYAHGIYAASKSMVLSLVKSLAAELSPYNIRVNSFSPGVIETKMSEYARKNYGDKLLKNISLNRFGNTHEVAQCVLFLASDASSYIQGIDLDISGGKFIIQNSYAAY